MKEKYDDKVKNLVDYIKKIRENIDFFDFNVDNAILRFWLNNNLIILFILIF